MNNMPKLSVIVCFKDWGLDRLEGVTRSILQSGLEDEIEIIVADYGSTNPGGYRESLESLGARYFYFATNGIWSRSRALNLGIREAKGKYLVTTDADMVFLPSTFPRLIQILEDSPRTGFVLQCRDLPEGIEHSDILDETPDWELIESKSRLRPRWGMGGLIAFERDAYVQLRGLDERFEIYGGEDLDLAKRLVRAGYKRVWINDPLIRMYHVWHPSSRESADSTPEGRAAIARNTEIHKNDKTYIRNLSKWHGRIESAAPLVTVAISTFNRAEYIMESIGSVRSQTFADWELVIVNDGSTDETKELLDAIEDPRIRVIHQENKGLAAARNLITKVARGKYIAVHDDDDLMLPTRLEDELGAIKDGAVGATGGWIDFDNVTGQMDFCDGKRYSLDSVLFNSGVYLHPTLLIERRVMEQIPYNETMRSGSDYNLSVRMARAGVKLQHCGKYVMLRRRHEGQITNSHGEFQRVSGRVTGAYGRALMTSNDAKLVREVRASEDKVNIDSPKDKLRYFSVFLPDHLSPERNIDVVAEDLSDVDRIGGEVSIKSSVNTTDLLGEKSYIEFEGVNLSQLHMLFESYGSGVSVSTERSPRTSAAIGAATRRMVSLPPKFWESKAPGVYCIARMREADSIDLSESDLDITRVSSQLGANRAIQTEYLVVRVPEATSFDQLYLVEDRLSEVTSLAGKVWYVENGGER